MSINDFVEMNIFLWLICSPICAKIQGLVYECVFCFYAEIQDGRQKWQENDFWKNSAVESADTLWVKNFAEKFHSISHRFQDNCVFAYYTKIQDFNQK